MENVPQTMYLEKSFKATRKVFVDFDQGWLYLRKKHRNLLEIRKTQSQTNKQ